MVVIDHGYWYNILCNDISWNQNRDVCQAILILTVCSSSELALVLSLPFTNYMQLKLPETLHKEHMVLAFYLLAGQSL